MSAASEPFWVTAILDLSSASFERGTAFWAQATGCTLSAPRGEEREFATLVPADGDDHLKVQRRAEGESRIHLDLHVADAAAAAREAEELGARVVHRSEHGYVVVESPGGLTSCFVHHPARTRTRPVAWPGGHRSLVDQVCLDVPPPRFEEEVAFWSALTGWDAGRSRVSADFVPLHRPEGHPLRFLLQRLGDDQPATTAHLDLATTDRAAETERHVALGATVEATYPVWTVLRDPAGSAYCLTDRDPETGMLPGPSSA